MEFSFDLSVFLTVGFGILVFYLTKSKERESDRRRFKIERYAELVTYLRVYFSPDLTKSRIEDVSALAKALNEVNLMAGKKVMEAIAALQTASIDATQSQDDRYRHLIELCNNVVLAMREDIDPGSAKGLSKVAIPMMLLTLKEQGNMQEHARNR